MGTAGMEDGEWEVEGGMEAGVDGGRVKGRGVGWGVGAEGGGKHARSSSKNCYPPVSGNRYIPRLAPAFAPTRFSWANAFPNRFEAQGYHYRAPK